MFEHAIGLWFDNHSETDSKKARVTAAILFNVMKITKENLFRNSQDLKSIN
jgi:hypothetical protein